MAIDTQSHAVRFAASSNIAGGSRLNGPAALGVIRAGVLAGVASFIVKMIRRQLRLPVFGTTPKQACPCVAQLTLPVALLGLEWR